MDINLFKKNQLYTVSLLGMYLILKRKHPNILDVIFTQR